MPIFNSYVHIKLKEERVPLASVTPLTTTLSPVMKLDRAFSILKGRMREALDGVLKPAIYVMSADCGTGKSTAAQAVLKEWKAKGFAGGGGAIIFVGTLAEVDAYKDGAGLDRQDYAVLSPDLVYSRYGAGMAAAETMPVLFVTHEKAQRVLTGLRSYADADAFHYKGKPRALRVWEEGFLPVQYASFSFFALTGLPRALKSLSKADASFVYHLAETANRIPAGETFDIPLAIRDVAKRVFASKAVIGADAQQTLDALAKLAGSRAVKLDDDDDCQFVGIGRPLPVDLGPLFVLDASARLTNRYDDWAAYGMDIVRMEPALISYEALTIHWWIRGSGKSVLRNSKERDAIYSAIAKLIASKPTERFLIVMAKEFCALDKDGRPTLPLSLGNKFADPSKISVTTWGRHLSSNDHREAENVILLGGWDYDNPTYSAIDLARTGVMDRYGLDGDKRGTKLGEFGHNVYQAVCRSSVRSNIGTICGKANAYFIMVDSGGRRGTVEKAFPGASIQSWQPELPTKEDKTKKVLAILSAMMADRMFVTFAEVMEAAGSEQRSYLTKIIEKPRFVDGLKALRIKVRGNGAGRQFIRITAGST